MISPLDAPAPDLAVYEGVPVAPLPWRGTLDAGTLGVARETADALIERTAAQRNDVLDRWNSHELAVTEQLRGLEADSLRAMPLNAEADFLAERNRDELLTVGLHIIVSIPFGLVVGWAIARRVNGSKRRSEGGPS